MNISGSLPVNPVQPVQTQTTDLRVNQRINAEVIQVNGTTLVLSVDGTPVVARLTLPDMASELQTQHYARFIVRDTSGDQVTLQWLRPEESVTIQTAFPKDLAGRILEQNGMVPTEQNLVLARSALRYNLQPTPELIDELGTALNDWHYWGKAEADLAAALKAAGLPITSGTLDLSAKTTHEITPNLVQLLQDLKAALNNPGVSTETAKAIQRAISLIEQSLPDWSSNPQKLAGQLQKHVEVMGKSLEYLLAQQAETGEKASGTGLMTLTDLYKTLTAARNTDLAGRVSKFIDEMRYTHLLNTQPESSPVNGQWSFMEIPLRVTTAGQNQEDLFPAHLRMARRENRSGNGQIDPAYTRLVIAVEIEPDQVMQVDLSIVSRQVLAEISAPDSTLCEIAKEELTNLALNLENLGFNLQSSRVDVRTSLEPITLPAGMDNRISMQPVNIEV